MEFVKEICRVIFLGVISYLLTEGVVQMLIIQLGGKYLDPTGQMIITGGILSILRAADKELHKQDKGFMGNGLTGF